MKSKQPLSKLKRTIGASLAAVALLATTACDADKATNPQSGGIDGAREAIEKIQTDDALAERLPDKYTSSISVGMTFTFPPMRYELPRKSWTREPRHAACVDASS